MALMANVDIRFILAGVQRCKLLSSGLYQGDGGLSPHLLAAGLFIGEFKIQVLKVEFSDRFLAKYLLFFQSWN